MISFLFLEKKLILFFKASHEDHAIILLWETKEWKIISKLTAHTLTVTQLAFSSNDEYLLSVSRDRTWNLFQKSYFLFFELKFLDDEKLFIQKDMRDKNSSGHSRVIWTCAWTKDSRYFATGSRDKLLNIWLLDQKSNDRLTNKVATFHASDSVTAVDFSPLQFKTGYVIIKL